MNKFKKSKIIKVSILGLIFSAYQQFRLKI